MHSCLPASYDSHSCVGKFFEIIVNLITFEIRKKKGISTKGRIF